MIGLIAFIILMVGGINWFCIGLLQFDFVAGLFGSQASIFSRVVYVAVGCATLIILYNLIVNKGKIVFNLRKKNLEEKGAELKENMQNLKTNNSKDKEKSEDNSQQKVEKNLQNENEQKGENVTNQNENNSLRADLDKKNNLANKNSHANELDHKDVEVAEVSKGRRRHNYLPSYAERRLADAKIEAGKEQGYYGLDDYSQNPNSDTFASESEVRNIDAQNKAQDLRGQDEIIAEEPYQSASEVEFNERDMH